MKSEEHVRQLREALKTVGRAGAGRPYPPELRRSVVEYHRRRKQEGASVQKVASELGVSGASLVRWSRTEEERGRGFRAIELVAEPVRRGSGAVVHGPRGLRVEGLTMAELAELVERLS
jgi:transposase-like protein